MRFQISASIIACIAILGQAVPVFAASEHNPANTISLAHDHADSFRHFAREHPELRERVAQINTEIGLHVSEIEPGLFFVTDQIYQSAFLVTGEGVVVFDAPPSIGEGLRKAIEIAAPGAPITHLIMSHGHSDHNGGGYVFADLPNLAVIAAREVADTLERQALRGVSTPTRTVEGALSLTIGGTPIELRTTRFHAEDADLMIYLPEQKFLMAIDSITPGEVPFMNFGATTNVNSYFGIFDTFLAYDFEHFLAGHVSVLGTRDDVVATRDYAFDVRDTISGLMPTFQDRIVEGMEAVEFQNDNLAFRYAIETIRDDCARGVIERWQTRLSVVDLWADSHCETALLYSIMH